MLPNGTGTGQSKLNRARNGKIIAKKKQLNVKLAVDKASNLSS